MDRLAKFIGGCLAIITLSIIIGMSAAVVILVYDFILAFGV